MTENYIEYKNKIYSLDEWKQIQHAKKQIEYYDILQGVKKVSLNSLYGALLSPFFRFNRKELGASVTATGRQITTHMNQTIGEMLSGQPVKLMKETFREDDGTVINVYRSDNPVLVAADTDSVDKESIVETDVFGRTTIEELFNKSDSITCDSEKEYAFFDGTVETPCFENQRVINKPIRMLYRHKVPRKERWKITLENGKSVVVTGDHSIMVIRNGKLIEICARDIKTDTDICISTQG